MQVSALIEDGVKGIVRDRDELERLAAPGRTIKFRHVFLLADPRARARKGGWRKDLLAFMGRMAKRGTVIKDVSSGLSTGVPGQHYELMELVMKQLASNGRTLHLEGRRSGRKPLVFPADQMNKAEKVWLNVKKYRTEAEAGAALKAINPLFFPSRARKLWGSRKYSQS